MCEGVTPKREAIVLVSSIHHCEQTLLPLLFDVSTTGVGAFWVSHHDSDTGPSSSSLILLVVILPPLRISHQSKEGILRISNHSTLSTH